MRKLSSVLIVFSVTVGIAWLASKSNSQPMGNYNPSQMSQSNSAVGNDRMLMSVGPSGVGPNQVLLFDTQKQVLATYWIAPESGIIQLKSVRNVSADLQLDEFNAAEPSPSKVRGILTKP
jgi:hypothetical protein